MQLYAVNYVARQLALFPISLPAWAWSWHWKTWRSGLGSPPLYIYYSHLVQAPRFIKYEFAKNYPCSLKRLESLGKSYHKNILIWNMEIICNYNKLYFLHIFQSRTITNQLVRKLSYQTCTRGKRWCLIERRDSLLCPEGSERWRSSPRSWPGSSWTYTPSQLDSSI